ncbi:MAG: DNA translocase FtsK [Clostridia bacterium]|nr:DNA translocase FtsK [Clostridia bacterium]
MLDTLIFTFLPDVSSGKYGDVLSDLYADAPKKFNCGLQGGLLGKPLVSLFGTSGAKVTTIIIALLLLGLTVGINIITFMKKKHDERRRQRLEAKENAPEQMFAEQLSAGHFGRRRRTQNIDIPVDEDKPGKKPEQSSADPWTDILAKSNAQTRKKPAVNPITFKKRASFDVPLDDEPSEADYAKAEGKPVSLFNNEIVLDSTEKDAQPLNIVIPHFNGTAMNNALTRRQRDEKAAQSDEKPRQLGMEDIKRSGEIDRLIDQVTHDQIDNKPKKQPIEIGLEQEPNLQVKKQVFVRPPVTMYRQAEEVSQTDIQEELRQNAERLVEVLRSFGVETRIVGISRGPSVTRYELQPAAGVKISRITSLSDDIALGLAAISVRIEAPIPGRAAIGIEIPNHVRSGVSLREILESDQFKKAKSKITVALGRDITGKVVVTDLAKMPHLLIAGTTGSGKSVTVQCMIQSVLYNSSPDEVKILLIDPKQVEFKAYNGIPNLLVPVVTEPRKAAGALGWAVTEMLKRYNIFADNNVRDIYDYNEMAEKSDEIQPMPQILIIVDEFSDLMMTAKSEVEDYVCRLAQMARAAGMHLVIATQRPSTDVITGLIKANIPSRLALSVSNNTDSRVILDQGGAEKLLGNGDMLFSPIGASKPTRIQGCYVSIKEINDVTDFLRRQQTAEYDESVMEEIEKQSLSEPEQSMDFGEDADELLPQAVEIVLDVGEASATLLQRRLRLGYARAGRLVDAMEKMGIVGPHEGSKPRKLLIGRQEWQQIKQAAGGSVDEDIPF